MRLILNRSCRFVGPLTLGSGEKRISIEIICLIFFYWFEEMFVCLEFHGIRANFKLDILESHISLWRLIQKFHNSIILLSSVEFTLIKSSITQLYIELNECLLLHFTSIEVIFTIGTGIQSKCINWQE